MRVIIPPIPHVTSVRLAALAYEDYSKAKDAALDLGYVLTEFFERDGTEAYLFESPETAALSIRGTQFSQGRFNDLLSNAGFFARSWDGPGMVHRGYAEQWKDIERDVLGLVDTVSAEKKLIVDGHSMGGAVANIAVARIVSKGWNCRGLVTFGAPKSVDQVAADWIIAHVPVWRFTNRGDFANGFPPTPFLAHPGPEYRLNSGGSWFALSRHTPDNFIKAVDKEFPQ